MDRNQTEKSFRDKWNNNPFLALRETSREGSDLYNWILSRNGFGSAADLETFLKDKKRILDAGCGNGRVIHLLRQHSPTERCQIVGCDLTAHEVAKENCKDLDNVSVFQADLMKALCQLGKFDFIYCQEVLHHTTSPVLGFKHLVELLQPGGEIAVYVYKLKAPMREYCDDFIREKVAALPYEDAMEACRNITELGKSLSKLGVEVQVPEIPLLEIKAGSYDIQRFFYHFFMKAFWNDSLSFEENVAINYDWYHPSICSRHTEEEVRSWFTEEKLEITQSSVDFYGITMRGRRN